MSAAHTRTRGRVGRKYPASARTKASTAAIQANRQRSARATRALEAFADLRRFFASDSQLAEALTWDEATVAKWRDHLVVRPQVIKVMQVLLLDEIALEARAYMRSDSDVGSWLNAPTPNLRGATPARWVRQRGHVGVTELTHGLVDWMPRIPERDLRAIDPDAALAYLDAAVETDEGARELKRMLSDLT